MVVFAADLVGSASPAPFFGIREEDRTGEMKQNPTGAKAPPPNHLPQLKKKRNLPGNPNPDSEVIALSPKTLMATNRFVCEVCNKGFQREQNLQLHRRGHNLPWKLKQKSGNKDGKRKVYPCPEPGCVHHDTARALGDLTGIKKHYFRKHGEKKWKCERCQKRYGVQSDWKAHSKTCGTREYRCNCGTLFSRRDSFVTHRAFCDALAQETAGTKSSSRHLYPIPPLGLGQPSRLVSLISGPFLQDQNLPGRNTPRLGGTLGHTTCEHFLAPSNPLLSPSSQPNPLPPQPGPVFVSDSNPAGLYYTTQQPHQGLVRPFNYPSLGPTLMQLPDQIQTDNATLSSGGTPAYASLIPNSFFNSPGFTNNNDNKNLTSHDPNANLSAPVDCVIPPLDRQFGSGARGAQGCGSGSGCDDSHIRSSLYGTNHISRQNNYALVSAATMSATTLLQKASETGPNASDSSMVPDSMGSPTSSCPNSAPAAPQMMSPLESDRQLLWMVDSLMNGSPTMFAAREVPPPAHSSAGNHSTTLWKENGRVSNGAESDRPTLDFLGVGGGTRTAVGPMGMVSNNMGDELRSIMGMNSLGSEMLMSPDRRGWEVRFS